MKTTFVTYLLGTGIALFGLILACSDNNSESQVGNGGEPTAQEFVVRGRFVLYALESFSENEELLSPSEYAALKNALDETRVVLVLDELKDRYGISVVALTTDDPQRPGMKWIRLNEPRWRDLLQRGEGINQFVFHEYLWAIGKDDTNYVISSRLKADEAEYRRFRQRIGTSSSTWTGTSTSSGTWTGSGTHSGTWTGSSTSTGTWSGTHSGTWTGTSTSSGTWTGSGTHSGTWTGSSVESSYH